MHTITYALPASAGSHTISVHDEATILDIVFDGLTLLVVAAADTSHALLSVTLAVVRASPGGVATPTGRTYVGSTPVGLAGYAWTVYR